MGRDILNDPALRHRPGKLRLPGDTPASAPRVPLFDKLRFLLFIHHTLKHMKRSSWKTTLGGLLAGAAPFIKPMLPANWSWVSEAMLSLGALIVGLSARDNNVSSEAAGAK